MTKQEVIDAFKTELSKSFTIRTSTYKDGKKVDTKDVFYPHEHCYFDREIVESALAILEGENDI